MPAVGASETARSETLLAFDVGVKKIGIAIGNTVTCCARPLEILQAPTRVARFARITALINEWRPERLVVGLPLTLAGDEQESSRHSRRFANQLHGRYRLPVELIDERGSSLEAQAITHNAPDDSVAAAIILQRYFDQLASGQASMSLSAQAS